MATADVRATPLRLIWVNACATGVGALLLLLPAFINGYPLVNSDDGTYINSGFLPEMPGDRPIAYGLLLRIFSLNGISMWAAVAVQALVVAWLLLRVVSRTTGRGPITGLAMIAALAVASSLSWITSEIIPDVCTPMALMAAWLLLNGDEPRLARVLTYCIFFASMATHISHLLIFGILIGGFFLLRRWLIPQPARRQAKRTVAWIAGLSVLALLSMVKPIGSSNHVFTVAALLDAGLLKPYLDEVCPTKSYALCRYKDDLNSDPNYFLWEQGSPLYKEGGWKAVRPEYRAIVSDVHSRPKYLRMRAEASLHFTGRQLSTFGIGDGNVPFHAGDHVHGAIVRAAPRDEAAFLHARQQRNDRPVEEWLALPNKIIYIVTLVSLAALLPALWMIRRPAPALKFFVWFCFAGILINAWVCATAAQVNGRYGCRMMWLIPFCAGLLVLQIVRGRKSGIHLQTQAREA